MFYIDALNIFVYRLKKNVAQFIALWFPIN